MAALDVTLTFTTSYRDGVVTVVTTATNPTYPLSDVQVSLRGIDADANGQIRIPLSPGTYQLLVTVSSDPAAWTVTFEDPTVTVSNQALLVGSFLAAIALFVLFAVGFSSIGGGESYSKKDLFRQDVSTFKEDIKHAKRLLTYVVQQGL